MLLASAARGRAGAVRYRCQYRTEVYQLTAEFRVSPALASYHRLACRLGSQAPSTLIENYILVTAPFILIVFYCTGWDALFPALLLCSYVT